MRRSWFTIVAGLMLAAGLTGEAEACRGKACRWKAAQSQTIYPTVYQANAYLSRPVYATPYGVYATPVIAQPTPVIAQPAGSDAGAFLVALNQWRAQNGRPPLAWDPGLAAAAATNAGVHSLGSSGGGMQVWSGTRDYGSALAMWESSPSHAAILLSGTSAGVSSSATGLTLNVR